MMIRRVTPLIFVPAAVLLAGCSAGSPSGAPTTDAPAGPDTCDSTVFTDNVDADITAEATPLTDPPFPLDGLEGAGLTLTCTAHLSVTYTEAEQTVEFDIAVTSNDLDSTSAALDDITADQKWVRDEDQPIWREDGDQNHYVEALAIDDGVLVGTTAAG